MNDDARRAVYEVIASRRDVREFQVEKPLEHAVVMRILEAAHRAPSVGYSQPWDFVLVRDRARRARIRDSFLRCRMDEAAHFKRERKERYLSYKLEGILESALNICVTVRGVEGPILGATAQPDALVWSVCCAVQNLWLAARAEGVGVGWVSIVEPAVLRAELKLPPDVDPIAYLCVGYPIEFRERPMLEETGWAARRNLADAIHHETF
jgi:5,6-dimethylbenzimidazole synthase